MDHEEKLPSEEYQYGFKNEDVSILKTKKGLTEETIRDISRYKHEPKWMLEFRLKALMNYQCLLLVQIYLS